MAFLTLTVTHGLNNMYLLYAISLLYIKHINFNEKIHIQICIKTWDSVLSYILSLKSKIESNIGLFNI